MTSTSSSDDECFDGHEWKLREYEKCWFRESDMLGETGFDEVGRFVDDNFSSQIDVEFPSPLTDGECMMKNKGYVGNIQLPGGYSARLTPKVEIENVFEMMEHAYDLGEFEIEDYYQSDSVEGFYDRIANVLAQSVSKRRKKGLHKTYVQRSEKSQTIRGRINFSKTARKPWEPDAHIEYSEMTADNEDNQILYYTLLRISSSSNLCRDETLSQSRRCIRSMSGNISYREFGPSDCAGRGYNRLNEDYRRMHGLCRLILDNSGASHEVGSRKMVPFNIDMSLLYQKFVASWLRENLPNRFGINYRGGKEETVTLTEFEEGKLQYRIDIVLYDIETNEPLCVMDVKYKDDEKPNLEDISQVIGYSEAMRTENAFLLYPSGFGDSLDVEMENVRVQNLTFPLDGDLDENGAVFLRELAEKADLPELAQT